MKRKIALYTGLLLAATTITVFAMQKEGCFKQVIVSLDYIQNSTNRDYWLEIPGQQKMTKLPKQKTAYIQKKIITKNNICNKFTEKVSTIYSTNDKKNPHGYIEFKGYKEDNNFIFTASLKSNRGNIVYSADSVIESKPKKATTFNTGIALQIGGKTSTTGQFRESSIELLPVTIQPDILD